MATQCSFDVTSTIDLQEVDNALNQARKEVAQRYDFKGTKASIEFETKDAKLVLVADDEFKLNALWEIVSTRLIRRNVIEAIAEKADKYLGQDGVGQVANVFEFSMLDGKFVGEDYTFCDKATAMGFKVWVDVEICLPHVGVEEFTNDFKNEVVVPLIQEIHRQKLKVA